MMTLDEKNTITTLLLNWNFSAYKGKIKLYDIFFKLDKLFFNGTKEQFKSQKIRMKFINAFFPYFLEAWKTEYNFLYGYYSEFGAEAKFMRVSKILKKYYK